ncbi:hypothetical protein O181_074607 [Austropuccinia psidii MF-1]|uniref:Uncharacterized protein n=1 Tax=Austropuccinia psidii MF-1 TaxID=1389203 RepID=A0A9Q3FB80_9BASI|nr:hypothetical protein [Austropuccinia psidii MF-1]
MVIFVHEMTSSPPPDHLTPLPFLLLHMDWLLHHPLMFSASRQDMLPLSSLHLILSATYHSYAPAAPSRYDSNAANHPYAAAPQPHLLRSLPCSCSCHSSNSASPYLPSPILTLLHPHCLPCLCSSGLLAYNAITEIC